MFNCQCSANIHLLCISGEPLTFPRSPLCIMTSAQISARKKPFLCHRISLMIVALTCSTWSSISFKSTVQPVQTTKCDHVEVLQGLTLLALFDFPCPPWVQFMSQSLSWDLFLGNVQTKTVPEKIKICGQMTYSGNSTYYNIIILNYNQTDSSLTLLTLIT